MKKILAFILALALLPLCAAAETSPLQKAYKAFETLMTGTDNVTLTLKADFEYEGVPFKKVDAAYIQAETDSLMDLEVYTASGTYWKESGYKVAVKNWEGYALQNPLRNGYYTFTPGWKPAPVSYTKYETLFAVAGAVVDLGAASLAPYVTEEDGTVTLKLKAGEAPYGTGALLKVLIEQLAKRYMNVYSVGWAMEEVEDFDYLDIIYEDYNLIFEKEYENETGGVMPGDFFDHLWTGENDNVYDTWERVTARINEKEAALNEEYGTNGVVVVDGDYGTTFYPSWGDYLIAMGWESVSFDEISYCLIGWHKEKTGEEWTLPLVNAMKYSGNQALAEKYQDMVAEMEADYLQRLRDEKKAVGYVLADGSMITAMDSADLPYDTTARIALSYMNEVHLGDTEINFTFGAAGEMTGARGDVTLLFVSEAGREHPVHITFEAEAKDFGTSEVGDIEVYFNDEDHVNLPEEVVIDGVSYSLKGN